MTKLVGWLGLVLVGLPGVRRSAWLAALGVWALTRGRHV